MSCTTDAACSDGAVTIAVSNFGFSKDVLCRISDGTSVWGNLRFTTTSSGTGSLNVPTGYVHRGLRHGLHGSL